MNLSSPSIHSMLDDDLYKFNMQNVVLQHYPDAEVVYKWTNRNPTDKLGPKVVAKIKSKIETLNQVSLTKDEDLWLHKACPWFTPQYRDYLWNYRFNPNEVSVKYIPNTNDNESDMELEVKGKWHSAIRWEVPLMAIISEVFFKYDVRNTNWDYEGQERSIQHKAEKLQACDCTWADFGTRRRRSYRIQDMVVGNMKSFPGFVGTSNVHLAHKHDVKPIGTQAHEMFMAISALESLRHANKFTLNKWAETYQGELGIALTDTFGTKSFFKDFDSRLARLFDGVRHDSGCPFKFGDSVIDHYKSLKLDPLSKTIVFSDSLNVDLVCRLVEYFQERIKISFGIGTHFTNDWTFNNLLDKALNMVIKMFSINGIPIVKLSDDPSKATGDPDALRIAKYVHLGTSLD